MKRMDGSCTESGKRHIDMSIRECIASQTLTNVNDWQFTTEMPPEEHSPGLHYYLENAAANLHAHVVVDLSNVVKEVDVDPKK